MSTIHPSWTLSLLISRHLEAISEVGCWHFAFRLVLTTGHTAVFLERLQTCPALPANHLFHLDGLYKFSQTTNSDIRMPFYLVVLKYHTSPAAKQFVQSVLDWVIGKGSGIIQGRMKHCRPLFRAANKVDRDKTVAAFNSARELFHPIARKFIEEVYYTYPAGL